MIDDVKLGSKWTSSDYKEFIVLGIVEDSKGTWVHYRTNKRDNNTEHSCLKESFLHRFTLVVQ
jgi:hypothetical protein